MSILIRNARVLTMDDDDTELARADILVRGTRIAAIGPDLDVSSEGEDLKVIPAENLLAMPGLVNGHFHSPGNFLKGATDDAPLEIFMLYEVPPFSDEPPSPHLNRVRTMLGAVEMLKLGVTAVSPLRPRRRRAHPARPDPEYRNWPTAPELLWCLTRGGARGMGLEDRVGVLAAGYEADIILVDLNTIAFTPLNDLRRQLVFCEKAAGLIHKLADPEYRNSELLWCLTRGGARGMGLEDRVGVLAAGYEADISRSQYHRVHPPQRPSPPARLLRERLIGGDRWWPARWCARTGESSPSTRRPSRRRCGRSFPRTGASSRRRRPRPPSSTPTTARCISAPPPATWGSTAGRGR